MQFTHQHLFPAGLDRVVEMLADGGFARERARASGAEDSEAWVDGTADTAFTVGIRRVVPATSIPSEFRSVVGKDLHVRYTEAWEAPSGDDRVGTFAVEIVGAPGHVGGALGLTPSGDGTEFLATGEVKVSIPLFGSMVERAIMEAVLRGLTLELSAADEWLTT